MKTEQPDELEPNPQDLALQLQKVKAQVQRLQQLQKLLNLLNVNQSQTQTPSTLLCRCCLDQPDKHFQSISLQKQARTYPYNCIGKLIIVTHDPDNNQNQVKQTQSTGFLISDGIVMTAATCIISFEELKKKSPKCQIYFQIVDPNLQIKIFKVSLWVVHEEYLKLDVQTQNYHYDVAILFIEKKQARELKRKLKIAFKDIDLNDEKIHIITCPSKYTQVYQKYKQNIHKSIQLMSKLPLNLNKVKCQEHNSQKVLSGFEGSPLLRQFKNDKGEIDYEVVILFKNYSLLEWKRGLGFRLAERSNDILQICKLINQMDFQKVKDPLTVIQQLTKYSGKLLVFQCKSVD